MYMYSTVCVFVRMCVRACVRACVGVCVHVAAAPPPHVINIYPVAYI